MDNRTRPGYVSPLNRLPQALYVVVVKRVFTMKYEEDPKPCRPKIVHVTQGLSRTQLKQTLEWFETKYFPAHFYTISVVGPYKMP